MKLFQILYIECSPRRDSASSSRMGAQLLAALQARAGCATRVIRRNLGAQPLPALSAAYAESLLVPIDQARATYGSELAMSDELVEELVQADLILIAAPVHNFGIPAVLKNWIDWVVRRDVTFKVTPQGKVGLVQDRPVVVAVTSGGAMFREPPVQPDFFRPYLRAALGVVGITNIDFVESPCLAFSSAPLEDVDAAARSWIQQSLVAVAASPAA